MCVVELLGRTLWSRARGGGPAGWAPSSGYMRPQIEEGGGAQGDGSNTSTLIGISESGDLSSGPLIIEQRDY